MTPTTVHVLKGPKYEPITVPCKNCWQCKENRVKDYTGRCMAEAKYSDWVTTLTLTYEDQEDNSHRVLHKNHFQKFVRALRKAGHRVRYLVVGEYGDEKGRAHFHCILFGIGKEITSYSNKERDGVASYLPQKERTWLDKRFWPFGHVFADNHTSEKAFRYTLKYMKKNKGQRTKYWFSLSKKPALGARFFKELALEHARSLILPYDFAYRAPGAFDPRQKYFMQGATRRDYLLALKDWFTEQGHKDLFDRLFEHAREVVQDNFDKVLKWRFLKFEAVEKGIDQEELEAERLPEMSVYELARRESFKAAKVMKDNIAKARKDIEWYGTEKERAYSHVREQWPDEIAEAAIFEDEIESYISKARRSKAAIAAENKARQIEPQTLARKLAQYAPFTRGRNYVTKPDLPAFGGNTLGKT